jgi:hypothetical protein
MSRRNRMKYGGGYLATCKIDLEYFSNTAYRHLAGAAASLMICEPVYETPNNHHQASGWDSRA